MSADADTTDEGGGLAPLIPHRLEAIAVAISNLMIGLPRQLHMTRQCPPPAHAFVRILWCPAHQHRHAINHVRMRQRWVPRMIEDLAQSPKHRGPLVTE